MTRVSMFRFDAPETPFRTVSELTAQIKSTLERNFGEVALRGEISNLARPRSGHVYFSLKDDSAQIRAVMWKNDAERVVFDLADGLQVKALGKVSVYAPRGEYQLVIRAVDPEGIGALELAFRQLHARLAAEGLFEESRKRPLPEFPRRIVVVTSPTGAAVHDFAQVAARRWPLAEILIAPAKVQGIGAAEEVVAAIALANRVAGANMIVLCRGGGSLEDLWTFNEEIVARAIVGSRLPVISAIGHEVDFTIADFVADFRASTPSVAAERCVPDSREVAQRLDHLGDRLARAGRDQIENARATLQDLSDRSSRALTRTLDDRRHRLARLAASLEALSPLGVLARGYSVTFLADGKTLLRSPGDVQSGDRIVTRLAGGSLGSRVE
jgi:exodeoxyribonuclease VII large subunit